MIAKYLPCVILPSPHFIGVGSGNSEYVIWNIYDETINFAETRCICNPDVFDKKQAEAFYNEMLKWG